MSKLVSGLYSIRELPLKNTITLIKTTVHPALIEKADPSNKDTPKRALENNATFTSTIAAFNIITSLILRELN